MSSSEPKEATEPAASAAEASEKDPLELVREAMKAVPIKSQSTLSASDRCYRDECVYSFDTPFSPGGLYVNLSTWQSAGAEFLDLDARRSGARLYLHLKMVKVPEEKQGVEKAPGGGEANGDGGPDEKPKPSKLAIGVEGGFSPDGPATRTETESSLFVYPQRVSIPLPNPGLPELVLQAVDAATSRPSATAADAAAADASAWEEGERRVSRYAADLPQLEVGLGKFGRLVPPDPSLWECESSGMRENLWLNLSTGYVGGGRANWDGTGGSGAALRHYEETGRRYPLAVKLGTITPEGGGDVYSYAADEDDMVLDPNLSEHLAHWGISTTDMTKRTDKTVAEMQVDLNLSFEFDRITESGAGGGKLKRLGGPGGLVGLSNLGNSCYVASVAQALYCVPPLRARYSGGAARRLLESASPAGADVSADLLAQTAKLVSAMVEGRTGKDPAEEAVEEESEGNEASSAGGAARVRAASVRPSAFKRAAGAGHPEFSGARQQDAVEYLQHLLDRLSRAERAAEAARPASRGLAPFGSLGSDVRGRAPSGDASPADASPPPSSPAAPFRPTADALRFAVEEKVVCCLTGAARYGVAEANNVLSLDIPLEAATNAAEVEAAARRAAKRAKVEAAGAEGYVASSPPEEDAAARASGRSGEGSEGAGGGGGGGGGEAVIDAASASAGPPAPAENERIDEKSDDVATTDERVLPRVPFAACLSKWAAEETVEGYRSAAAGGAPVSARRSQRLASFPPFLAVQLKRYYVAPDWTPKKLEVLVDVPDVVDLGELRARGPQPGEKLQPEGDERDEGEEGRGEEGRGEEGRGEEGQGAGGGAAASAAASEPDPQLVASLVAMGFSENGSKRAVLATASAAAGGGGGGGSGGGSVEVAMEWVLAHMEDADFNDPLPPPPPPTSAGGGAEEANKTPLEEADPESLEMLQGMGFEPRQAAAALKACQGSLERAADWLFSRAESGLDAAVAEVEAQADAAAGARPLPSSPSSPLPPLDNPECSTYRLAAVVSHMGSSTACGHYVAHALREDERGVSRWVLFNDDKVAASARVPRDLGFLYLFARADVAGEAGVFGPSPSSPREERAEAEAN